MIRPEVWFLHIEDRIDGSDAVQGAAYGAAAGVYEKPRRRAGEEGREEGAVSLREELTLERSRVASRRKRRKGRGTSPETASEGSQPGAAGVTESRSPFEASTSGESRLTKHKHSEEDTEATLSESVETSAPESLAPLNEPLWTRSTDTPWWRPPIPRTVYRYLSVEILRVFVLANLAVSLFYTTMVAYQTVRSGLQISLVWPLVAKTFAYPLYYSIPISFLFGVTLVIGRMVSDLEITALRTHGVSYVHIFTPIMIMAVLLGGLSFYLNGWVVPHIHYEKRNIHRYVMEQLRDLGHGENRRLRLPDRGTLWIGAHRGTELRKVHIAVNTANDSQLAPVLREHLPEGLPKRVNVFAREGSLELAPEGNQILLRLRGVDVLIPETVRGSRVANEKFHQRFTISDTVVIPLRFNRKRPSTKDRTNPELLDHIARLERDMLEDAESTPGPGVSSSDHEAKQNRSAERYRRARTEWHRRLAFTFSCFSFSLVGLSLALVLQGRSRLVPFFLANLVVIGIFYPLLMIGTSLGDAGWLTPVSMALPNLCLIGLGIFLTRKVVVQ